MSGKSISITIPIPLVDQLQDAANMIGISRSRFITNLLLKWQERQQGFIAGELEQTIFESVPSDCPNREEGGFCKKFDLVCNAPQNEASTCMGYPRPKGTT